MPTRTPTRTLQGRFTLVGTDAGIATFDVGGTTAYGLNLATTLGWLVGRDVRATVLETPEGLVLAAVADAHGSFQCLATWDCTATQVLLRARASAQVAA